MSQQELHIELPFIGSDTKIRLFDLRRTVHRFFPQVNAKFYFRNNFTLGSLLRKPVGGSDMTTRSCVVYEYTCDCCQRSYIGSTVLQMFVRSARHAGVSHRTGKPYSSPEYSSIREHCNSTGHCFKYDNFSVIDSCTNSDSDLRLLETIHIYRNKPYLNRNQTAMPLNII